MTQVLVFFLIITAVLLLREKRTAMLIVYLAVFSLVTTLCYMMMGSPDVAMAEAAASAFTVVFFIVCFEKYYGFGDFRIGSHPTEERKFFSHKTLLPLGFTVFLAALFIVFIPDAVDNTYLKDRYLSAFARDVGGSNAVTAIYLGYRVYDTLFEALVVVISVVAAIHLSAYGEEDNETNHHSEMENSGMAVFSIQIICPIMLLFGVYLILNGHITPGGGFQGGLAAASFFICRYMIYDVNDLPIKKLNRMEEMVFIGITLFAASIVFLGGAAYLPEHIQPIFQIAYLVVMNLLIGLKVAFGFIILFYRFIVIEQR